MTDPKAELARRRLEVQSIVNLALETIADDINMQSVANALNTLSGNENLGARWHIANAIILVDVYGAGQEEHPAPDGLSTDDLGRMGRVVVRAIAELHLIHDTGAAAKLMGMYAEEDPKGAHQLAMGVLRSFGKLDGPDRESA